MIQPRSLGEACVSGMYSIDTVIRCYLAGWLGEETAASELKIGIADFRAILQDHGLANAVMMPFSIDPALSIAFVDVGSRNFNSPRFDDVIDNLRETPESRPLCFPLHLSEHPDGLKPAASGLPQGLIFHVGRCGSTLLCRLLDELLQCTTIREPEVVNRLLAERMNQLCGDTDCEHALLRLLQSFAFGARRASGGQTRGCLVKMTSWNLVAMRDLLDRLDDIPTVFLVRDPIGTAASMIANPPGWYLAGRPDSTPQHDEMSRHFATEWVGVADAALRLKTPPLIVDYDALITDPWDVVCAISDHCRLTVSDATGGPLAARAILDRYAKSTEYERYDPEGRHKRNELSDADKVLVSELTSEVWHKVRALKRRHAVHRDGADSPLPAVTAFGDRSA